MEACFQTEYTPNYVITPNGSIMTSAMLPNGSMVPNGSMPESTEPDLIRESIDSN